jgi:cytochrome c biogenesis protein CcmG, thiol:disulfide interchange protein DsbE
METEHTQTENPNVGAMAVARDGVGPCGTLSGGQVSPGRSRKRSIIIFVVVSLLNAGLLALLWSQLVTPAPGLNNSSTGNALTGTNDPLKGKPAPDFTLAALSTHAEPPIHLANLRGKPVVINFWASWCSPCADEAPLLQAAWQHAGTKGVIFIGIDYQDTQSDGLSFLQKQGITYPSAIDANGATAINYGVTGTPETFFIDRRGVVVATVRSQITAQQLQTDVSLLTH